MTADPIHTPETTLPSLLTIAQTADVLQVNARTIRRWIDSGDLVAHRLGRGFRISEADLQTFIRTRREP
ncbi:MAG: helix-turn-helix domain-containing protein [Rhodospirillales bacterium]|nr:helix-turn-helix domain-containing protein [Alphaproteobacteria bacterium]MBL6947229.1 helix-turn-helix domain-containing protein [Rhodospirillales bacterium]